MQECPPGTTGSVDYIFRECQKTVTVVRILVPLGMAKKGAETASFGSAEDVMSGDSDGFTTIDGGFKIGAGFNF